jgi:tRNA nucleotidyltransferase (CCA-adding enzyme)
MPNFNIDPIMINSKAFEICNILQKAGYQSFIVGGCIRDLLLSISPKDWDITTDATPEQVMNIFPKNIPTGLQHGTITVVMGEGVENHFEITTFRVEGKYSDGRRPEEVSFVVDIKEDLARRDLTINAIAYDPISNSLVDPFNGINDLKEGVIKAVGNADDRFQEDGLRIMRAARFAARFSYYIDRDTMAGMQNSIDTLKKVSKERIQDELCKTIMTKNPLLGLQMLLRSGALPIACPFLTSSPTYLSFVPTINNCQGELETRIAFLYGNILTPQVKEELLSLKFSNSIIKKVTFLLDLLEPYENFHKYNNVSKYKDFMARLKNYAPDHWEHTLEEFITLTEAMGLASGSLLEEYKGLVVLSRKEMAINGDDLLAAGMAAGPRIKKALDECYLEVLRNPENNTKYRLLEVARQF